MVHQNNMIRQNHIHLKIQVVNKWMNPLWRISQIKKMSFQVTPKS